MKIGFVSIGDASDISTWSGIPFHILKALRDQGHEVDLISPLRSYLKWIYAPQKMAARLARRSIIIDHYPLALRNYAAQIASAIRGRQIDVVFSTSSIPVTYLECPQPIVFWTDAVFHGMVDYYNGAFRGLTSQAIRRGMAQEETSLRKAAAAIYSSNWAAQKAVQLVGPDRVSVIHFGSNVDDCLLEEDLAIKAAERRTRKTPSCNLLFCGVDWARKGGDIALEAARIMNEKGINTQLTVVGCEPLGLVPQFVKRVGFLDKSSRAGAASLRDEFLNADVFILPTKAEAAGIVFCEAAAFGLPMVTQNTGGTADYVRDGENGFCLAPNSSGTDFAEACLRIVCNAELFVSMSLRSLGEYNARLNWKAATRKLGKIFEDVRSHGPSTPGTGCRRAV